MRAAACTLLLLAALVAPASHPYILFTGADLESVKSRARSAALEPTAKRLMARAEWQLHAPPLIPSVTKRGEPDPPGEQKGLSAARALQGRVLTYAMAFTGPCQPSARQPVATWTIIRPR